jgi:hypothetical protein
LGPWLEAGRDLDAWQIPQLLDDLKALREGKAISLPDLLGFARSSAGKDALDSFILHIA